jgi:lipopolysaccharide/colanic/teichoic acid biosynthesis glycosyltransferase
MLDTSFASRDRIFDEFARPEVARPLSSRIWHPRLVLVPPRRLDAKGRLFKRLVDLACALTGLVLLALPALCLMLAIRLNSPGPVLFRQRRTGLHGQMFTLLKFRTMYLDPGSPEILRQCTRHDSRVTWVGRWLRRYSLDELPQLINVLRGDMSIVGPRPHAPGTRAGGRLFEDVTHRYAARHSVKPGMTGLAQVLGWRGETDTEEKLLRRVTCDLEYIATWSTGLDLSIICRTAGSVLRMRNAY